MYNSSRIENVKKIVDIDSPILEKHDKHNLQKTVQRDKG